MSRTAAAPSNPDDSPLKAAAGSSPLPEIRQLPVF
jgi:hypothetical protein